MGISRSGRHTEKDWRDGNGGVAQIGKVAIKRNKKKIKKKINCNVKMIT